MKTLERLADALDIPVEVLLGIGNSIGPVRTDRAQQTPNEIIFNVTPDPEACVWIAESDDVPGLVLESGSFDALVERVRFAVPELLALNGTAAPIQLHMVPERRERLAM